MRGRKPKPLRIQIAEGDTRKRGVNKLKKLAEREPRRNAAFRLARIT
jgi:hypothetical protein